eukprot:TRINITY_DN6198_c0_g1_i1.p2 TRINITY_DN6198_c0_g1~~TRINITY_DN6198_c0_g1_i1.p2  ORF type:complete len:150 (+),score=26.52 TRINITY_DN6198_c0_g1_i1:72-521(+)
MCIRDRYDFISENEVFETEHTDYTFAECLNGICSILSLEQYDNSKIVNSQQTFFTRAKYDVKKQKIIDPPIQKWPCNCLCQKPINPDLTYINCDKCFKWFHISCANIDVNKITDDINYICWNCQKFKACLLYTSPSPRDRQKSRMPSSA